MIGKIRVRQGIRPGVVAFSLGPWALGRGGAVELSTAVTITRDERRATGVHANAAMRLDPVLKNTGLWTRWAAAPCSIRAR